MLPCRITGLCAFTTHNRSGANRMALKQIVFTGKRGSVSIEQKELGKLSAGHVRVKVSHSGISPGTELLGLERSLKSDEEFRMGYQIAGTVVAASPDLANRFKLGERVACYGGPYVYHASVVDVPMHLITPLPDNVDARHASFCALASVALHGFRHTECRIGETVAVIGLGLLGNLAAQCARAAGCRVVCSELLPRRVKAAADAGLEIVPNLEQLQAKIITLSTGHGADAIILAVKNTDTFLLSKAYEMVRRLGRVVVLGLSDAQLPRELMFSKEATIVVSRAAGWGRYSREYELEGRDLPFEHARWTEGRNLEESIRLMSIGGINIEPLITDEADYTDCTRVYSELQNAPAEHLAVLFRWP